MKFSKTLEDLIAHQKKFDERIHLVASENSLGMEARLAFLCDALNRYYFPLSDYRHWAFPGNEYIELIHKRCAELLRKATGAAYVNVRPISGINAMTVALAALTRSGDSIATFSPQNGGHAITATIAERLGLSVVDIPYHQDQFDIDYSSLSELVARRAISLLYFDQAHMLFPINVSRVRKELPESVKIYYDGSHVMGLIFGKAFQDPLAEGATFLGGNTHKTIPGPHKAFIASRDTANSKEIDKYSNALISHDHMADVAALTLVLEDMEGRWEAYATQVVKNAQFFAKALDKRGFVVAAKNFGFTKSHQIWIDTRPHSDAFEAVMKLARLNIITNTIYAPSTEKEQLVIRAGVQEVTYLGGNESTMEAIADIFEDALIKKESPDEAIKNRVREIKKSLSQNLPQDWFEKAIELLNPRS